MFAYAFARRLGGIQDQVIQSHRCAFLSISLIKIISFVVSSKKIAALTLNDPPEILMPISE